MPNWLQVPAPAAAAVRPVCPSPGRSTARGPPPEGGMSCPCLHLPSLPPSPQPPPQSCRPPGPPSVHRVPPCSTCCRRRRTPFSANSAGLRPSCRAPPRWRPASSSAASSPAVPAHCAASGTSASSHHTKQLGPVGGKKSQRLFPLASLLDY